MKIKTIAIILGASTLVAALVSTAAVFRYRRSGPFDSDLAQLRDFLQDLDDKLTASAHNLKHLGD